MRASVAPKAVLGIWADRVNAEVLKGCGEVWGVLRSRLVAQDHGHLHCSCVDALYAESSCNHHDFAGCSFVALYLAAEHVVGTGRFTSADGFVCQSDEWKQCNFEPEHAQIGKLATAACTKK